MKPSPRRVVTFYSYKGGTGRSMMLANFAWILAAHGSRVLVIDWDLEAPGLHRYFRPFLIDPDLLETDGLIDRLWRFTASSMAARHNNRPHDENLGTSLESIAVRLDWTFATGGHIDLIGAGRQGPTYSERVNTFDWNCFYELGGAAALTSAREYLLQEYDWILIDSRTGVSDTSGICTIQMPDTVVPCFTLNRQSIEGSVAVLRSIRNFKSEVLDGSRISFFPIATRIENAEQLRLEKARGYARSVLSEFIPAAAQANPRNYWDGMEITYRPIYAFEEVLAAFGDTTGAAGAADTMLAQVETVAQCITGDSSLRMPEILEKDRAQVLAKYALGDATDLQKPGSTGTATDGPQATKNFSYPDPDTDFLRGVLAKEQLWRKEGFPWHRLLSQRELDLLTEEDRKSFGRAMNYYVSQSEKAATITPRANRNFIICLVLTSMVFLLIQAYYRWTLSGPNIYINREDFLVMLIFGTLLAYSAFSALLGGLIYSSNDKPYNLSIIQAIFMVQKGPFRRPIQDYNPKPDDKDAR